MGRSCGNVLAGCDRGHGTRSSNSRGSNHGYVLCVGFGRRCNKGDDRSSSKCRSCLLHPFELLDVHELLLRTDNASGMHDVHKSDHLTCGESILPDEIGTDQSSSAPQAGFALFAHEISK
jgi:hypothetical protein